MADSQRICKIESCGKKVVGWGLCGTHYKRWRRHGVTDDPKLYQHKACLVDGCKSLGTGYGTGHGYCSKHYARFYRHGHPLAGGTPTGSLANWLEAHAHHDTDDCLTFPFGKGRGTVTHDGVSMNAARAMCFKAFGPPPDPSYYACHKCRGAEDGCVNPKHLYWGTPEQNQADRVKDGTMTWGEKVHSAKLSVAQVREIRRRAMSEEADKLALEFGVKRNAIARVVNRTRWAWLE